MSQEDLFVACIFETHIDTWHQPVLMRPISPTTIRYSVSELDPFIGVPINKIPVPESVDDLRSIGLTPYLSKRLEKLLIK